jgi:arginyl-tRNA synthetase
MTTVSLPCLEALLAEMGVEAIPSFAVADVLNNPLDIYHSYLAKNLQTLVDCDPNLVYNSIQPSSTIEDGDLDIILPKLKLHGVKPQTLADELLKKVGSFSQFCQS